MADVWTPDDPRTAWTPRPLRDAEEAWIARRLAEQATDHAPSRRLPGRMQKAVDRWSLEAGLVALGLTNATATLPPPSRAGGERTRRASGPSDPTGAVVDSTWQEVSQAAWRWAHLTGPCALDGTVDHDRCCGSVVLNGCKGRRHDCPDSGTAVHVADLAYLQVDCAEVVDGLMGTPPSSTAAWTAAVGKAAVWHTVTATETLGAFRDLSQAGAEPSHLERIVAGCEELARSMAGLAGSLAGWSGRQEATCAAGCGGARPAGRATCGRCRTAAWRGRQAG